jgi:hypothetical protein
MRVMRNTTRATRAPGIAVALIGVLLAGALALAAPAGAAVSPADFSVRALCATPAPGHAGCLALELNPRTSAAKSSLARRPARIGVPPAPAEEIIEPWEASLSPLEVQKAYALPSNPPTPQTIAIVDAYDDANVVADLATYSKQFLGASSAPPACTIAAGKVGNPVGGSLAEGCFLKVDQAGHPLAEGPRKEQPTSEGALAQGWAGEIATDVELAHGLCVNCRVVLVEASTDKTPDLEAAENEAATLGANEISNSWGGEEPGFDSEAFNHPGVVVTASAGDAGYLNWTEAKAGSESYFKGVDYPASSPHVIAVGGTALELSKKETWNRETVWNEDPDPFGENSGAGGGGCSSQFIAPSWQQAVSGWSAVGCGSSRAVADVAADGDPYTGVAVYNSTPNPSAGGNTGWVMIGGTSVASPIIASTFALAGGAGGVPYPVQTLYSHVGSAGLHDITAGGNGECKGKYTSPSCGGSLESAFDCGPLFSICHAGSGYDGPTGVGTPAGIAAFQPSGQEGSKEKETAKGGEEGAKAEPKGGEESAKGKSESEGGSGPSAGTGPAGAPGASAGGQSPGSSSGATTAAAGSVRLSNLALTFAAIAALNRGRPRIFQIAFTFSLTAPARVRVTLARRVRVHGRWRWAPQPGSFTLAAAAGGDRGRLRSRHALRPGRYRLTLAPAHGAGQSLALVIG